MSAVGGPPYGIDVPRPHDEDIFGQNVEHVVNRAVLELQDSFSSKTSVYWIDLDRENEGMSWCFFLLECKFS